MKATHPYLIPLSNLTYQMSIILDISFLLRNWQITYFYCIYSIYLIISNGPFLAMCLSNLMKPCICHVFTKDIMPFNSSFGKAIYGVLPIKLNRCNCMYIFDSSGPQTAITTYIHTCKVHVGL